MQRSDFYFLATIITAPLVVITAFQPDYPLIVLQVAYLVSHIFWPAVLALVITSLFMTRPSRGNKYHLLFIGWLLLTYIIYGYLDGDLESRIGDAGSNPLMRYPYESMMVLLGVLGVITLLSLRQVLKAAKSGGGDDKKETFDGVGFTFIFSNVFIAALIAGFVGVFLWLPSCEQQPWPRRTVLGHEISLCRMAGCHEIAEYRDANCDFGVQGDDCETVYKCAN